MHTLYLTADEKKLFEKLPGKLREGCEVKDETQTYKDSSARQTLRLEVIRLHDPKVKALQQTALAAKSEAELMKIVEEADLSGISDRDLTQLLFALGPEAIKGIISTMFAKAQKNEDIEQIAAFSALRNGMFESLQLTLS